MDKNKWPADGHLEKADESVEIEGVIFEDIEHLPVKTQLELAFYKEAERVGRFDIYRKNAEDYLKMAKEAKAYADQTLSLAMKILTELPFPKVVLQVENIIHRSRPIIQRTLVIMDTNVDFDDDKNPDYTVKNLKTAKMASQTAYSDLLKIVNETDLEQGSGDEKQMKLPEITDRQKRIAKDRDMPENVRKREIPRLADDIEKGLNAFALGNAFITLHDIDGLMGTLQSEVDYFKQELDDWKSLSDKIHAMKRAGVAPAVIRDQMLRYGFKERVQTFHDVYLRLKAALNICLGRMDYVNKMDNELFGQEYTKGLVGKMLRDVIDTALKQTKQTGLVSRMLRAITGNRLEQPKQRTVGGYEKTLREAYKRRSSK